DSTMSVSSECIVGKDCELQDNTFVYSGYSFVEWNTQPDGLGDGYQAGETITVNDAITLYAIWKIAPISSLKGEVTADGTVILKWDRSSVEDIAGYRVYCSVGDNSS
ncbi:MAG: InlB B-repeat-containing protein, partial [Parabacteroides distasonis]|nr:InlB B-repeat-containing protein [Parabacteroides distasonis]